MIMNIVVVVHTIILIHHYYWHFIGIENGWLVKLLSLLVVPYYRRKQQKPNYEYEVFTT